MRVAVTGSHGLIGRHLIPALKAAGHGVVLVVRPPATAGSEAVSWDPATGRLAPGDLAGLDAVVHLAGVGIAARRWNAGHKQALLDSRLRGTALLASTLAALAPGGGPAVWLSASAVGFYGDRGDEELTESSRSGSGFLADLCRRWEEATGPAAEAGVRTVLLRTGLVQSADGGALRVAAPVFRLGVGGRFGSGRQWWSWVSIEDEVGAILHALAETAVAGPVNLTAPEPVTNAEYTATLARVLGRPALLAVPAAALEVGLGREMAGELLLASQRARSTVLERTGYRWRHPALEGALRSLLRRPAA